VVSKILDLIQFLGCSLTGDKNVQNQEILFVCHLTLKTPQYGGYSQSHYREVPRWEIFMEQELRFGLELGRLSVLKKKRVWADYEQLLRVVFSFFQGQKKC
jgi:hypothetical protein